MDDLNTPRALAALFDLAREINRCSDAGQSVASAPRTALRHLGGILGLTFEQRTAAQGGRQRGCGPVHRAATGNTNGAAARPASSNRPTTSGTAWSSWGVSVEDTPNGPVWQFRQS